MQPIEVVAEYLSRGASIVDVGHRREMDLSIEVPNDEFGAIATSEMWAEIYDRIAGISSITGRRSYSSIPGGCPNASRTR